MAKRDYKKEYARDHSSRKSKQHRAKRNTARRRAERSGKVKKGDGKHVDHKRSLKNGGSNNPKNLRVVSAKANLKKGSKNYKGNRSKKK